MTKLNYTYFFDSKLWLAPNNGPRYLQLARHIKRAITSGELPVDSQLPPEREIAALSGVSRVTVRKSIANLVTDGAISQQQGSGSYVKEISHEPKLEQSLSSLSSFTENMHQRGMVSESRVLSSGLFPPMPHEMVALGLSKHDKSARVSRLRTADGVPMAVEISSMPSDILPRPQDVQTSLYEILRKSGVAPVRAIQRISASNLKDSDAKLMGMPVGSAMLQIDRTGYLSNGRPVEFTRGIYRSDIYDFVAELILDE